jgi:hypothetical protein
MQEHDEAGKNRLNFEEWSLEDLARIVPDRTQTLHKLAAEYATVQLLADKTQQLPLMVSCGLCLMKPLLMEKNKQQLQVLCNLRNRQLVVETIKQYVQKFNFPPPPVHLGSLVLKQLLLPATSPISGEAQGADKDKKDEDENAQDDEKANAGYNDNTSADNNTCADASPGAGDNDIGAAFKQDSAFRWYPIPWVIGSTSCKCAGNCGAGCAARTREDGLCPNPVSQESRKEFLAANKLIRCQACKCQHPGCLSAARRPFAGAFGIPNTSQSRGRCIKHWLK